MLGEHCRSCSSSCPCQCQSGGGAAADSGFLLNKSPRLSSYFNPIVKLDRALSDQASLCWESDKEKPLTSSVSSNDTQTTPKSGVELKEEIAILELEIMRLERHLLCLYRTAFDGQISTLPSTPTSTSADLFRKHISSPSASKFWGFDSHFCRLNSLHHSPAHAWTSPYHHSPVTTPKPTPTTTRGQKVAGSGHRSLADHLGASCIVNNSLKAPDRLSEDIVRCISSVYCKLANPPPAHVTWSASPNSSLSSSTVFSSRNPCDSWSPRSHHGLKEDGTGPYAAMIQVLKIRLDSDTFNYAAKMLQYFRSLVRNLEKVDPRKMKREEKLAFWINIHNALVMHAYLAYGSNNRVKTASIFKAAYNVGGHCINAYIIQSSILGIRSHNSAPWLQTLFPGRKFKARSIRHEYALEYPEPLVHFALCSGEYFDPAVRAYTANSIFGDLKTAKEEFIQASVRIEKETKILLPRVLYYFVKDVSLTIEELLDVIVASFSESEDIEKREIIRKCVFAKGRPPNKKCIHWLPHISTFRYFIHPHLAPTHFPFPSSFPPHPQD